MVEKLKPAKSMQDALSILEAEQKVVIYQEGDAFGNYYPITGNNW